MGIEIVEAGAVEEPVRWTTSALVVTIIASILLALSAVWFYEIAELIVTGGNDVTCSNQHPDRHVWTVVAVNGVAYGVVAIPAMIMLTRRRLEYAAFALFLALVSFAMPLPGLGYIIFSIGMC